MQRKGFRVVLYCSQIARFYVLKFLAVAPTKGGKVSLPREIGIYDATKLFTIAVRVFLEGIGKLASCIMKNY